MAEEDYFPATKIFVETTIEVKIQDRFQNIGLSLFTFVQKVMS